MFSSAFRLRTQAGFPGADSGAGEAGRCRGEARDGEVPWWVVPWLDDCLFLTVSSPLTPGVSINLTDYYYLMYVLLCASSPPPSCLPQGAMMEGIDQRSHKHLEIVKISLDQCKGVEGQVRGDRPGQTNLGPPQVPSTSGEEGKERGLPE